VISRHCVPLIESEKQKLKEQNDEATNIFNVALSSGAFSDEELADQVTTFLAAGHETTASALVWAIYLLCKHPKVQSKLRKEILVGIPDQNCEAIDCHSYDVR
jgi:cytochrome P450